MIPFAALLTLSPGVRVAVVGEGKLRFAVGREASTAAAAILSANAQGLLADAQGRPVSPAIRVGSDAFRIAMNGTVTVSGAQVGTLYLERPGKGATEIGLPGTEGFGIVMVGETGKPSAPQAIKTTAASKIPTFKTAAAPVLTKACTVTVRPTNEVSGERILLGDVADLTGDAETTARLAKIDLGGVPTLDSSRSLGLWAFNSALRDAGFPVGTVTITMPRGDVRIVRKGQTIDAIAFVKLATQKATEFAGVEPTLTAQPMSLRAPLGETTFNAIANREGDSDMVNVRIEVVVDGKSIGTRTVGFRAKLTGVKVGDAVRVAFTRNGAEIMTEGKARSGGSIGATVQVQTADGALVSATVTGTGTVEVKL